MKPNRNKRGGNSKVKTAIFVILVFLIGYALYSAYNSPEELEEVSISNVINRANNGEVSKLIVTEERVEVVPSGDEDPTQVSIMDANATLQEQGLTNEDVEITFKEKDTSGSTWLGIAANLILPLGILFVLFMMFRSAQGQGNQAMYLSHTSIRASSELG